MPFIHSCRSLVGQLTRWEEVVAAIQLTISEDRPSSEAPALCDRFDNQSMDLLSAAQEARICGRELERRAVFEAGSSTLLEALAECQSQFSNAARHYVEELACHEALEQLLQMGRERGRAWQAWSGVVVSAIRQAAPQLDQVQRALSKTWFGLGDHLADPNRSGEANAGRNGGSAAASLTNLGLAERVLALDPDTDVERTN